MNLLGIDTATEACTVALQLGNERQESIVLERQHAERLLGEIEQMLAKAGCSLTQLDALVWGRGPGMFTGLRIGAGIVQGLAYAIDRPVVCVSTLAVLARAQDADKVIAAIDARMGQVYWAAFENRQSGPVALTEELVSDPSLVRIGGPGEFVGTGSGWDQYSLQLSAAVGDQLLSWTPQQVPRGAALLSLGQAGYDAGQSVPATEVVPVYVRNKVANKIGEQKTRH